MLLDEYDAIADANPNGLGEHLRRVGEGIRHISCDGLIRADELASRLSMRAKCVEECLKVYAEHHLIYSVRLAECEECEMLHPEDDMLAEFEEEEEYFCASCESPMHPGKVRVISGYRITPVRI